MTKKIIALASLLIAAPTFAQEAEKPSPSFSSAVADIGIVVKDLEKSATFYTETLGFEQMIGNPDHGRYPGGNKAKCSPSLV